MKKNGNVRISDEKKRLLLASAVIATGAVCYLFLKNGTIIKFHLKMRKTRASRFSLIS